MLASGTGTWQDIPSSRRIAFTASYLRLYRNTAGSGRLPVRKEELQQEPLNQRCQLLSSSEADPEKISLKAWMAGWGLDVERIPLANF